MTAYAYYEAGKYDDTIKAARRYVTLHPGSPDAAYAQYLIGSSYFDQIPDITRDQARTERALDRARRGDAQISRLPNMPRAPRRRSRSRATSSPARKWMIGRYYLERRDYTGAINRFKVVVTQYQTTRHVEEALMRLTEAYMALGIVNEAQTAAAVLGHNFPDSPWYKDAYKLVQSGGLEPSENKGSWISQAFRQFSASSVTRLIIGRLSRSCAAVDVSDERMSRGSGVSERSASAPLHPTWPPPCWPGFRSATSS